MKAYFLLGSAIALVSPSMAWAQSEPTPSAEVVEAQTTADFGNADIIVTARKRLESILEVPVVMTAVDGLTLERLKVTELSNLPKLVPGLNMGQSLLSVGTLISIRGIGTSSADSGIDQSVSVNIDGLSFSQGLATESGMFDVQQVEVLKGPQALFYGKASPGGVIALRTADPTSDLELIARAGYEFEAKEMRGELIASGPVTETLGLRLATTYSTSEGYFYNNSVPLPGTGGIRPAYRSANTEKFIGRATLLWQPSDSFSARLKLNLTNDHIIDGVAPQFVSCPDGTASTVGIPFLGNTDCVLDRYVDNVYMDPANFPGIINNGVPFLDVNQKFGTLELNQDITPEISITSVTGYYNLRSSSLVNTYFTTGAGATLAIDNHFRRKDFQQEFRLNSDFSSPINFTAGGLYQNATQQSQISMSRSNAYSGPSGTLAHAVTRVKTEVYSLFGQLQWKIIPDLELAGGARWTDETRSADVTNLLTSAPIPLAVPRIHASNIAPEITLTYTPTSDLTFFGAYKKGFKSGSFTMSTIASPGANTSFGDEGVKGWEAGIKSRLFNRSLMLNLAGYDYRYSGLQVGSTLPPAGGLPVVRTVNAGNARVYGIDFDASWRPHAVPGLGINAAVNWNHARFTDFATATCYPGQTIAEGCDQIKSTATQLFTAQDLSGTPLGRAPDWQMTFGFDYELPIGNGKKLNIANSNRYSSEYLAGLGLRPNRDNYQEAFFTTDLSLALSDEKDRWEVALVGNNITDKITRGVCSAYNAADGGVMGELITGGTGRGASGTSEMQCFSQRGRSVSLRVTLRPFGGR